MTEREKHILPKEIGNYDEAFLTGTAAEITPIQSIDEIKYATGKNTTSYKLMNDFTDLVISFLVVVQEQTLTRITFLPYHIEPPNQHSLSI